MVGVYTAATVVPTCYVVYVYYVYICYTHTQQIYLPAATLTPFQHDSTEVGSFHFQGLANYS